MGKLFVPISSYKDQDFDFTIKELHEMGAERLFLACGRFLFERCPERTARMEELRERIEFYTAEGFEVAIWITTFGFGGPMGGRNAEIAKDYARITSISGKTCGDALCPMDNNFSSMMADTVEDIAKAGARMIMLDDELCLSVRPGIGCACDLHMAELCRRLGENISREELAEKVFTGGASKYRDAWIGVQGDSMRDFCRTLRAAVDRVDSTIRLGFASGFTSWDLECADTVELTRILAGNTKPFVRLSGAPYWVSNQRFGRQTMQTIIEFLRLQYVICQREGIEAFTEGDTYPRSNYHTSSAFTECYDIGTRISDDIDSFKYHYVYTKLAYERHFAEHHRRNMPLYDEIAKAFNNKTSTGVRVYEEIRKFQNYDLPETFIGEKPIMKQVSFCDSQKLLTSNAIPTTYVGDGVCGIVFGENAKYIDLDVCNKGLILDLKAARILKERGVDTGIISYESAHGGFEKFEKYEDVVPFGRGPIYKMQIEDSAIVESRFGSADGDFAASYRYENKAGQRFLVFGFIGEEQDDKSSLYWSYARGEQIADNMKWLCGSELPARCDGHPHLYAQTKENESSIAVGYINFHADEIFDAEIKLAKEVENVRFIGCDGKQTDSKTVIINYINANSFAGFEADFKK